MSKRLPKMTTDTEAEALLEKDLSDYLDPQQFRRISFEFEPKSKSISLRMSEALLEKVKRIALQRGISYQRLIREAIEAHLEAGALQVKAKD
jgi:predicted DNA binding CopG/RHH family protein